METLYRKVAVSVRLPKEEKWYHVIDEDGNVDLCPFRRGGFSATDTIGQKEVKFWIESIPDPTAQLQADKAELLEALENSNLQIEYLHEKFKETGSGNSILSKNQSLIQKHKK